ncbi:uncharacterized protein LOC111135775 [Crassostrea virginica]
MEQVAGQHHLVCGNEDCEENGEFYCNNCHLPLCEQCRDEHLESPKNKTHETVHYRYRKQKLPVVKCEFHPTRNVEMFCRECQITLCSRCSIMEEHNGHIHLDLEEIFAERYVIWHGEFLKIQKYFLPTTEGLKKDIENDATQIKKTMEGIRASMKTKAYFLKNLVDEVTSENIEHTHTMEKTLLEHLNAQETTYDDYIAYLGKMTDEFQPYLSLTNLKLLFSETLKIKPIPETFKPALPITTASQINKDSVAKLLGRVIISNADPEKRRIQSNETFFAHLKCTEKQLEQHKEKPETNSKEKSDMKQTLSLSNSVTKVREYSVPGVGSTCHVSIDKLGRLWVNDRSGNLVQSDLQGNLLQIIQTSGGAQGYHTATQDGDLLYTDQSKKVIYRITPDKNFTAFIKTGDWAPLSIHSSRINGDILAGMIKDGQAKVIRYSKTGKEIQNIQRDTEGKKLYSDPYYITENINGDICISDFNKHAVVVVNKSGHHKFSYTGQGPEFHPRGICTDVLGHILVCDSYNESVHLLNQTGVFCSFINVYSKQSGLWDVLLSPLQGYKRPCGACVDDENNLYVGQLTTNALTVYKYLQ